MSVDTTTGELATISVDDARRGFERARPLITSVREQAVKLDEIVNDLRERGAHVALGYRSWAEAAEHELAGAAIGLDPEKRRELVASLSEQGMSQRAIAPVVGVTQQQVSNDLSQVTIDLSPDDKGPFKPEVVEAELVEEDAELATTTRGIWEWENGKRGFGGGGGPTNAQMSVTLEKHPWIREGLSTINRASSSAGLPARAGGLAWWLFTQIDSEDADYFFDRLCSDEDHHSGEPIHELRKAIGVSLSTRGTRSVTHLLAITIKAWNKYRDGESVGLLKFRRGGAKPETFPEPH